MNSRSISSVGRSAASSGTSGVKTRSCSGLRVPAGRGATMEPNWLIPGARAARLAARAKASPIRRDLFDRRTTASCDSARRGADRTGRCAGAEAGRGRRCWGRATAYTAKGQGARGRLREDGAILMRARDDRRALRSAARRLGRRQSVARAISVRARPTRGNRVRGRPAKKLAEASTTAPRYSGLPSWPFRLADVPFLWATSSAAPRTKP